MSFPGRFTVAALATSAALLIALVSTLISGCGRNPAKDGGDLRSNEKKADPWETVSRRLRKDTDLAACKTALGQLNSELAERSDVAGTTGLSEEALAKLKALVPLSGDDATEIKPAAYSALDPAYLVDCFYMRDAARSLDSAGLPPADRARLGFDWVCRQLYLNTWILDGVPIPAVPPTFALRRGWGTGLERAYAFLALLQQMGLDGCLVGSPGAFDKPSFTTRTGRNDKSEPGLIGPFWAVGVRIGSDILLFDPMRGEPFPGPGNKGIGTLAQVKANLAQLQPWFDDKTSPWSVNPDELKSAIVVLVAPLSSLTPRLATLEQKIKADTGVALAIDAAELKSRYAAAPPNGPGIADARFWNPVGPDGRAADRFCYCRSLHMFLSLEDGGLDRAEPAQRLYFRFNRSLVPPLIQSFSEIKELKPQPSARLFETIQTIFATSFLLPPSPRERIQRGQFQDAARDLTDRLAVFGRGQERLRNFDPAEVAHWVEQANAIYDNLNQARFPDPTQLTPVPDSDPEVLKAKGRVEEFWNARDGVARLLVDRATASIGRSEACFLLALAKHEEAERLQVRSDFPSADAARARMSAAAAWGEASNAWLSFLELESSAKHDARFQHAQALASRAIKFTETK